MKRSYRQKIESYIYARINHIDKSDFLTAFLSAREESIALDTVRNSFTATGLVPYDPEQVLLKLNIQLRTPTPPLPPTNIPDNLVPKTPYNIAKLEYQTKIIKDYLQHRMTSPLSPTDQALNQLVKGYQLAMYNAVLLAEENRQLRAANERQKKKASKEKRVYSY